MNTGEKLSRLDSILSEAESAIIACSGGTDSIFLLHKASVINGLKVMAVTVSTAYMHSEEISLAETFCNKRGIKHRIIEIPFPEQLSDNPEERCYLCKKVILKAILSVASVEGFRYVFDGTNADDINDYRPGMKALRESGVRSPLLEAGLTKKEIRMVSKKDGLETWNKPANACLLTRFPHGAVITHDELRKAEAAETYLSSLGFTGSRVRVHGDLARIEFRGEQMKKAIDPETREKIVETLKLLGYRYIAIDLEGYVTGKMNNKNI
jgi:pyridinium-3,5-biscarboxylic acid mononucleotide sulfurtransferase